MVWRLLSHHLGRNINDCASDDSFQIFKHISKRNTYLYEEIFNCIPSDNTKTLDDLEKLKIFNERCLAKTSPNQVRFVIFLFCQIPAHILIQCLLKAKKMLEKSINGFIVDFPLEFLSKVKENNFFPELGTKEGLMPVMVWT